MLNQTDIPIHVKIYPATAPAKAVNHIPCFKGFFVKYPIEDSVSSGDSASNRLRSNVVPEYFPVSLALCGVYRLDVKHRAVFLLAS